MDLNDHLWVYQSDTEGWLPRGAMDLNSVGWTQYATGGFPETGEAFVANEAGPELVGKIGNRNAVVNQQQIVESVSNGVAQAVSKVLGSGNDSKQTIVIKVGSTEIARAVIDGMNSVNRQAGQTILTV